MEEPPGSEERSQLISVLLGTFFGSYNTQVDRQGEAYLSLDTGLSVCEQTRGQPGLRCADPVSDELILWLASRAADLKYQEGQKLAKLVEAQTPDRPVPIISFVARQRDLSELIGDAVTGAQRLNFSDALKHWEGRFHTITLEDRNLPAIAENVSSNVRAWQPGQSWMPPSRRRRRRGGDEHAAHQWVTGRCSASSIRSAQRWCRR